MFAILIKKLGGKVFKIVREVETNLTAKELIHASESGISDNLLSSIINNNGSKDDLKNQFYFLLNNSLFT